MCVWFSRELRQDSKNSISLSWPFQQKADLQEGLTDFNNYKDKDT